MRVLPGALALLLLTGVASPSLGAEAPTGEALLRASTPAKKARVLASALAATCEPDEKVAGLSGPCALGADTAALTALVVARPEEATRLAARLDAKRSKKPAEGGAKGDGGNNELVQPVAKGAAPLPELPALGPDMAVDLAVRFAGGLAKLIVDRAKQEAVTFLLEELGRELCAAPDVSKTWFPATCRLQAEEALTGYGSGAAMLQGLQAAIRSDVVRWPGLALGAVVGPALFADPVAVGALGAALGRASTELLEGRQAPAVLAGIGASLAALAPKAREPAPLRLAACALALPQWLAARRELLAPPDGARTVVLAAILALPACRDAVEALLPAAHPEAADKKADGLDVALATLRALRAEVAPLEQGVLAVAAALDALQKLDKPSDEARALAVLGVFAEGLRLGRSALAVGGRLSKEKGAGSDELARALDALGSLASLARLAVKQDWPGLGAEVGHLLGSVPWPAELRGDLAKLAEPKALLAALDACAKALPDGSFEVSVRDGAVSVRGAATLPPTCASLPKVSGSWEGRLVPRPSSPLARVSKHVAALLALATAKDTEEMAKALDQLAAPRGGWRAKTRPGQVVISLGSQAGLLGGAEIRWGTYGAVQERGDVYGQAPALALPVGLEVSYGTGLPFPSVVGLFVSALDPVAFLQYDASKDGRLPGTSLKTMLAPGLGLRLGVGESPFSVLPYVVYRPGFRQWEPDALGTGADALQLGALLSVDVTLFELLSRGR